MTAIYSPSPGLPQVTRRMITAKRMPYGMCYKVALHKNHTVDTTYRWVYEAKLIKTQPNIRIRNIEKRTSLHTGRYCHDR